MKTETHCTASFIAALLGKHATLIQLSGLLLILPGVMLISRKHRVQSL